MKSWSIGYKETETHPTSSCLYKREQAATVGDFSRSGKKTMLFIILIIAYFDMAVKLFPSESLSINSQSGKAIIQLPPDPGRNPIPGGGVGEFERGGELAF